MDTVSKKKRMKLDFWQITSLVIAGALLLFLVYPLFSLLISSVINPQTGKFSLDNFIKIFSKKRYMRAIGNSLEISSIVTVLAILIGTPMAYLHSMYKIKGQKLLEALVIISMLSPPFIGAYAWVQLLGRSGLITSFFARLGIAMPTIYGKGGIIFVLTLKLYPFIFIYINGALKKMDVSLIESAESLGCGPLKKMYLVVLPMVLPTLLAGALLVFMNAMADFGTPMLIGEGLYVLPTLVYNEYISEMGGSATFSAALATILVVITSVLFLLQKYLSNRKSYVMNALKPISPRSLPKGLNILAHFLMYLLVFTSLLPHITVIVSSFLKTNNGKMFTNEFSFENYQKVFSDLGKPIGNSFKFALIALCFVIVISMLTAYISMRKRNKVSSFIDMVTMFPYILPGSVLGLTLLMAFNKPPIALTGTAVIIIIAFIVRRMPYTLRSSTAILYQISPSVEEAAISLGCPPVRTFFTVTAIMMLPGVFSGAVLSWVTMLNELSASIILYTGKTATMSVTIYQQIVRMNYGSASAVSAILTGTTLITLLLFFRFSGKSIDL